MSALPALSKREFSRLALSPTGIASALAFLFGVAIPCLAPGKELNAADPAFARFALVVPFVLSVIVPALTMGLWPDEEKNGTYKLLLCYPVGEHEIVLAKFLSASAFACLLLALTVPFAIISPSLQSASRFARFGALPTVSAYIGLALFSLASVSIGEFFSIATRHAIPAFLLALASLLALLSLTANERLRTASRGALESGDAFFFVAIIAVFLFLSVKSLEQRRRRP